MPITDNVNLPVSADHLSVCYISCILSCDSIKHSSLLWCNNCLLEVFSYVTQLSLLIQFALFPWLPGESGVRAEMSSKKLWRRKTWSRTTNKRKWSSVKGSMRQSRGGEVAVRTGEGEFGEEPGDCPWWRGGAVSMRWAGRLLSWSWRAGWAPGGLSVRFRRSRGRLPSTLGASTSAQRGRERKKKKTSKKSRGDNCEEKREQRAPPRHLEKAPKKKETILPLYPTPRRQPALSTLPTTPCHPSGLNCPPTPPGEPRPPIGNPCLTSVAIKRCALYFRENMRFWSTAQPVVFIFPSAGNSSGSGSGWVFTPFFLICNFLTGFHWAMITCTISHPTTTDQAVTV